MKKAHHSKFGWAFVAEYEADELASGSEDERRLEKAEKAEKAAEKRLAPVRKKARKCIFWPLSKENEPKNKLPH